MLVWIERVFFLGGLAVLAFLYGAATIQFQLPPYKTLEAAKDGWKAFGKLEETDVPPNLLQEEAKAAPGNGTKILSDRIRDEPILVTGGFYQNMDACPEFGCMAWIMDRDGEVLYTWSADPNEVIDGLEDLNILTGPVDDLSIYVLGVSLMPDGGLAVIFQGRNTFPYQVGIARFDIDGTLLWKNFDYEHHWPTVDADGTIYAPVMKLLEDTVYFADTSVIQCESSDPITAEGVRIYSADGDVETTFWMNDILSEGDYPGLAYTLAVGCDPHHVNGIAVVTEAAAKLLPRAKPGDLAISLRTPAAVLVIDRESGTLRHVVNGRFAGQHSPGFLADGTMFVFDNAGGKRAHGGSRIVAVNPAEDTVRVIFPQVSEATDKKALSSAVAGVVKTNPARDRLLISDSRRGRVIEVDAFTNEALWTYDKVLNIRPFYDARGVSSKNDYARFSTQGAYYLDPENPVMTRLKGN